MTIRVIVQGPQHALLAWPDLSLAPQALFIILLNQILDACSTRVILLELPHEQAPQYALSVLEEITSLPQQPVCIFHSRPNRVILDIGLPIEPMHAISTVWVCITYWKPWQLTQPDSEFYLNFSCSFWIIYIIFASFLIERGFALSMMTVNLRWFACVTACTKCHPGSYSNVSGKTEASGF